MRPLIRLPNSKLRKANTPAQATKGAAATGPSACAAAAISAPQKNGATQRFRNHMQADIGTPHQEIFHHQETRDPWRKLGKSKVITRRILERGHALRGQLIPPNEPAQRPKGPSTLSDSSRSVAIQSSARSASGRGRVENRNFCGNDAAQPSRARISSLSSITELEISAFSGCFVKGTEFSHGLGHNFPFSA